MRADPASERFLRRLEAETTRVLADRERAVLAFSGGLGSLVVASLARKRCDLRCVVAGVRNAPDLAAAGLTQDFLDYRLDVVRLTPRASLILARRLADRHPGLPVAEILSLVPLAAVRERHRGPLVAGFDGTSRTSAFLGIAESLSFASPLVRTSAGGVVPRARLLAAARRLGIPDAFTHVSARDPSVGSGVAPALRALAKDSEGSLSDLLQRDYH